MNLSFLSQQVNYDRKQFINKKDFLFREDNLLMIK